MTEEQKQIQDGLELFRTQLIDIIEPPYSFVEGVNQASVSTYNSDIDIIVSNDSKDVAIIKVVLSYMWCTTDYPKFAQKAKDAGYSFAIVYRIEDNRQNEIWIQDLRRDNGCFVPISSLQEFAEVLNMDSSETVTQLDWKMSVKRLIDKLYKKKYLSFHVDALEYLLRSRIRFDSATQRCYVSPDDEHGFFRLLLSPYDKEYICRYTTYETLERILREKKQSVRSVVCMNDKTECYYADDYLEKHGTKAEKLLAANYEALNKCQISSCAHIELADKLSLWRMYGDDGKGVCLKFKIDKKMLAERGFYLYCVNYAREDDERQWKLDLVALLRKLKVMGYAFEFTRWYIWKHFFKPSYYWDEKEVRLLYFKGESDEFKWIKTSDSKILAPVIEFAIEKGKNEFPLVLSEIILGPKFPEAATNAAQIKYFKELQQIEEDGECPVTISKIKGYR